MSVSTGDLLALDAAMESAFATGDASQLEVLGYGEITTVVVCESAGRRWACKRLPPFGSVAAADSYEALFNEYLAALSSGGVRLVPSVLQRLDRGDGTVVGYCVQPVFPAEQLAVSVLGRSDDKRALDLFDAVLQRILTTVSPRVGLDSQLSNWMVEDGEMLFLDVTTPMLRDAAGKDRLDTELFLAAVPPPIRPLFRRFLVRQVLDSYHDPRGVVRDLLANLIKEGQERHIARFLGAANERLSVPLTEADVQRHYAEDSRIWSAWQAVRRVDRFVRTRLLGRPYPFLLPGRIERRRPTRRS
jgi:Family of unknown function (DUF6206)